MPSNRYALLVAVLAGLIGAAIGALCTLKEKNVTIPDPQSDHPRCAVRGIIRPGAMCGSVIVGGKFCGHKGECPHKLIAPLVQVYRLDDDLYRVKRAGVQRPGVFLDEATARAALLVGDDVLTELQATADKASVFYERFITAEALAAALKEKAHA